MVIKKTLFLSLIIAILIAVPAKAKLIYAGGREPGIVYKYSCGTSWEIISPELGGAVLCLCVYEGRLYAGTTTAAPAILGSQADIGTESLTSKKQLLLSRALSSTEIGQVWRYDGGTEWTRVDPNLDNQVCSLAVFRGNLYAGTAWDAGKLYRYDDPNWVNVVEYTRRDGDPNTPWNGFRSLYVWNDLLYIGDYGHDLFGHYDGNEFTYDDEVEKGSCIWDFEAYDSNLYASAYMGRIHVSPNGIDWTTIRGKQCDYEQGCNSWELETFQDYLYVTTGPNLGIYDGNDFSFIWTEPNGYEIISMISTGDALILGTGTEAGSGYGVPGIGKVYSYDGNDVQLISGDMGSGIQALLVTAPVQLKKVDINEPNCVGPGDYITYTIDYNNIGGTAFNDVNIIDYLPPDVDFNSASGPNCTQPNPNTVIWKIGTLSPETAGFVTLTVKIRPDPGGIIINECVIESNCIPIDGACEYTPVCSPTLSKTDINDGNCVIPDDYITYNIRYDANGYSDTNVVITDYLPPEVDFNSAVPPPNEVNGPIIIWNIGALEPNESDCFKLRVRVNENAVPESNFINVCELTSGEQLLATAAEDTNVCPFPILSKDVNDGDCVKPDDYITYDICYDANGYGDTNVVITDYLPPEVDFNWADPYPNDDNGPCIIWKIGTLGPNDSNCIELRVRVNENAVPESNFINVCNLTSDGQLLARAEEDSNVCPWCCCTMYVDANASGSGNGCSWQNAYNYLQDALEDAQECIDIGECNQIQILVAAETYKPDCNSADPNGSGDRDATFSLINNVAIYGGFPPGGGPWEARDLNDPNNETTLSGHIGAPNDINDNSYHVVTGSDTNETAILDGFTITAGDANSTIWPDMYGGGMYNYRGSPTITNCNFSGNSAGDGGGMYNDSSSPTITDCTFIGNMASEGGGIYNGGRTPSEPNILNCIFIENSASYSGGGMYNYGGSPTITDCNFSENSANGDGGGIYGSGTITDCNFNKNSAENSGGGMFTSGSPTITDCNFSENLANSGGGIYSEWGSPTITNCIFSRNVVDANGGGIYNSGNSTFTNCMFTGNSADSGGGMFNYFFASPTVTNCTFSRNSAKWSYGGGMYNEGGEPTITNCIFWDDWAANDSNEIYNDLFAEPNLSYCDIQGCGAPNDWDPNLGKDDGGNIDEDPCFVKPGYWANANDTNIPVEPNDPNAVWVDGDFHLNRCSPCIDAGKNWLVGCLPPTDIDGQPRVMDGDFNCTGFADMGADEYYTYPYVRNCLVIDDFELYEDRNDLRDVWKDGYDAFENGSNITPSTVIDYRYPPRYRPLCGPIYEYKNALQFVYDNDGDVKIRVLGYPPFPYTVLYFYSEIEANIVDLNCVSDWTTLGVNSLSLQFYGDPCNAIGPYEQMYFAVEDGNGNFAPVNCPNMNNVKEEGWHEWNIALEEFTDANENLDLTDINKVYIGFGERFNENTPGGFGVVYFDYIHLKIDVPECLSWCSHEYCDWFDWGKPRCWCYERQCRGDIDGLKIGFWRVNAADLALFRAAFFLQDPQLRQVPNGICADLDHKKIGFWRVNAADLAIFRTYFFQTDPLVPLCDQPPIYTGPYNFWTSP